MSRTWSPSKDVTTGNTLCQEDGYSVSGPEKADCVSPSIPPSKTYGRTPDGTSMCCSPLSLAHIYLADSPTVLAFVVPKTHDMVSQLLDPRQPKNMSDGLVLLIIGLHIAAAWLLPSRFRRTVLAATFVIWRTAYNLGIGQLLRYQSNYRSLVVWARRLGLFADTNLSSWPRLSRLLRRELEAKLSRDEYDFATVPIEYNVWLLFRRFVDLILMCDFTSYCLFAIACSRQPPDESLLLCLSRWAAGLALVGFNLWVKLDAHRVVKDYAWYWGTSSSLLTRN